MSLCSHLYQCNCPDVNSNNLCKHIHKIHSLLNFQCGISQTDNFDLESSEDSESILPNIRGMIRPSIDSLNNSIPGLNDDKQIAALKKMAKNLAFEILEWIETPQVQHFMLNNIVSSFKTIASSCRGVNNSKVMLNLLI